MTEAILNPREISALVALVDQDRVAEAEQRARALLALHPHTGMLWKILGVALLRQGKDAVQPLRRTTELMPQDAEAHGNLGAALCDRQQWAEALVSLRRALAVRPRDVDALLDAADANRALGQLREAVLLYRHGLQLEPARVDARNNLGNVFLELGLYAEAADCYRLALEIKPNEASLLCNLGNAQRQLGRLDEAMANTRRALALDATLSVAHNNAGLILAAQGQREDAVASYRQALLSNPGYVEALNNLGSVLRDLGATREALACHARAVEIDPRQAESHCNLGNVLVELRRIDEAILCFQSAIALRPDWPPVHLSLATALRLARRAAEAESSCQAALTIDPRHVQGLHLLGELRADRGRFVEAQELFQRAIAVDPDFAFGYSGIAMHRKMTAGDGAWRRGAETLLAKRPGLADEISLRYALGKYFDDVGEYGHAFDHYFHANELTKRYGSKYDAAKLATRIDEIIDRFDAAYFHQEIRGRQGIRGSDSQLPVFIVGMPRSGTSLAEQILASHPGVFGAGELPFWDGAWARNQQSDDPEVMTAIARAYLDRLTASCGDASRTIDKMFANFLHCGLIHATFPRARIIHLKRHPIDTCLSIYFHHFYDMDPYAHDLEHLAHYYGEYTRIMDHWRAVLPKTALLEISYEALVADQEGCTRGLLEFIGLPWDPRCLEFHRTERIVITPSKWQVRQKITAASIGRHRHYLKFLGPLARLASIERPD